MPISLKSAEKILKAKLNELDKERAKIVAYFNAAAAGVSAATVSLKNDISGLGKVPKTRKKRTAKQKEEAAARMAKYWASPAGRKRKSAAAKKKGRQAKG
jgi:hypothetical protein